MELQEITGMKLSTNITIWPMPCSSAYRLLVRQATYTGDNLANTLVMKKRGGREVGRGIWGEAAGALIVPTPTLTHKYPTPMSLSRHNTIQIPYKYKYKYHTSTPHLCWGVNCPNSHTSTNTPHLCHLKSHYLCISQISSKISDKYPTHQTKDCFKSQSTNKGNGGNR